MASYDRAIVFAPGAAPAYNNKGLALMQAGRVEEGGRLIEMAIALDKKSGLAFYNLSLSKRFEAGDDIISVMEAFAREAPLADARRQDLRTFRPRQSLCRHRAVRRLVRAFFACQPPEARANRL